MMKRNIYIGLSLFVASILMLSFQNCGQTTGQAPVADGRIVLEDFEIHDLDCSQGTSCKATVVKTPKEKKDVIQIYPSVEYDFSHKNFLADEDVPKEFYRLSEESGEYVKCVFVNRRDDIRFEYLCSR